MRLFLAVLIACGLALIGCGGGGGGGGGGNTVQGRVLDVSTGGPPNPPATVRIGSKSAATSPSDGSFTIDSVPSGANSLTVDTGTPPSWTFSIGPINGNTDVGDLWIGPERVTVTGTVRDAATNNPIANATVRFAGRAGTTNAAGVFNLLDVAYSSATQTAFWGIVGRVTAIGYFFAEFSAQPNVAVGGVVTVDPILLTANSNPDPPGTPFNIWGLISAPGGPSGAVVRLKQGGVDVRVFNVGSDGRYLFFVAPGSYEISASKGASTAPDVPVTLTQTNEVIRRDIAIP